MKQPSAGELPVIVIGGGVSGLTLAFSLYSRGRQVVLLEARDALGGNISTEQHDGFLYDIGPDSFLRTKPEAKELCEELGLGGELMSPRPEGAKVFVAREGKLHAMPAGLALGFPTRLGALLSTGLLSPEGKLRALLEPFVPPRGQWQDEEESILAFTSRRVGKEMASRIVAPLLSGVFAGDATRLSMKAAFPQLLSVEQRSGSLFAGMTGGKPLLQTVLSKPKKPPSPFLSLRGGLGVLVETLASRLPEGTVRLGSAVVEVSETSEGARVSLASGEQICGTHVVVAGAPWAAARLLRTLDESLASSLAEVNGSPTATVFFGLDEAQLERPLDGSGFIVPPGEGDILAATWTSSKWEGRAPEGSALIRAFLGGARGLPIDGMSDQELKTLAKSELTRFMGDLGTPLFSRVFRYERGTPQPEIGHLERVAAIKSRLQAYPWLSLVGTGYGGVGIPDCIRQARETAAEIAPSAAT